MPQYTPPAEQIVDALAQQMRAWCAHPPRETGPGLVRFETPLAGVSPLEWLQAQTAETRYYWADRGGAFEMAGVGEADVLVPTGEASLEKLFAHMRTRLSPQAPSLRYYGGFRFVEQEEKCARWKAFKAFRFVVPRFEMLHRGNKTVLACNFAPGSPGHAKRQCGRLLEELAELRFPESTPEPVLPSIVSRNDRPSQAQWPDSVERALCAMARGELEKVVLARETCFEGGAPFDPVALLRSLLQHTVRSYEFCFHPAPDRAFIGASPERLYKRVNRYVQSEALAGTRARGATDLVDRALGEELLHDRKERDEHAFVVRMLEETLGAFCEATQLEPEPSLVRLRNCQHMRTRIEGVLHNADCDAELVRALHPTPAVGGVPRDRALAWLAEHEPFDRGIYAAPVGWVGYDATEFCVAIRSGLVRGNELALYNGAGIVAASVAEEEWDEIEQKMANFLQVFGLAPDGPAS